MERVAGLLLGDTMVIDEDLKEAPTVEFVQLLVDLHALDRRPFAAPLTGEANPEPLARAKRMLELWRSEIGELRGFVAPADWFLANLGHLTPDPAAVIQRDFHPWNVLVEPGGRLKVIDWTGITVLDGGTISPRCFSPAPIWEKATARDSNCCTDHCRRSRRPIWGSSTCWWRRCAFTKWSCRSPGAQKRSV